MCRIPAVMILITPQAAYCTHFLRDKVIGPDVPGIFILAFAGDTTGTDDGDDGDGAMGLLAEADQPMHTHFDNT